MTAIVHRPILPVGDELVVLDAERRLYAGLKSKGEGWHVIQPARLDDPRVGDGRRRAGDLVCTCESGAIRGTCYRTTQAEAFERGNAAAFEPASLDELVAVLA